MRFTNWWKILLLSAAILLFQLVPFAARADVITENFEGIPDGTPFTTLDGFTFSNAVVLTAYLSLDEADFPPHSGVNVIGDVGGPIAITGDAQFFSGYFTYNTPLTIDGYDSNGVLRAMATSLYPENYVSSGIGSPNELISISYALGLHTIVITGNPAGESFALDDITIITPEPPTNFLLLTGLLLISLGQIRWRRKSGSHCRNYLKHSFFGIFVLLLLGANSLFAAQVIDSVAVSPQGVPMGTTTAVTFTVTVTDPTVLPNSLLLQQISGAQISQLGFLTQSKTNPTQFAITIQITPTSYFDLRQYRVSAGFSGKLIRVTANAPQIFPVPQLTINASYVNQDNPTPPNSQVFIPLPANTPVYSGSGPPTSDNLALSLVIGPPGIAAPIQTIVWNANYTGPAKLIPPLPTAVSSSWVIAPLPSGLFGTVTFTATVFLTNGGQAAANIVIQIGIRSDDITVVGWINPLGVPPIVATGVNGLVTVAMPSPTTVPLGFPTNLLCNGIVGELSDGIPATVTTFLGMPIPVSLSNVDLNYILLWLFTYGSNSDPGVVLPALGVTGRADFFDPATNFTSSAQVAAYLSSLESYKLFNRLQVKFLTNGTSFLAFPTVLQQAVGVGTTTNPCGPATVPPLIVSVVPPIFTPPVTVPALFPGQIGPKNGPPAIVVVNAANPSGIRISQINDGSPDAGAIRAFDEISFIVTPPDTVYWENIGSQITFSPGGPTGSIVQQPYPTYNIYVNGVLTAIRPQAASPFGNFQAAPYPFGTVPCPFGTIVSLPGSPFFAPILGTIPGGRCGDASSPPDPTVRTPPPIYTVP